MARRRRLNLSLSEELETDLKNITKKYNFKTVCEFATTALKMFAEHIKAADKSTRRINVNAHDEIVIMFKEFTDWESTPDGNTPVRHNNLHSALLYTDTPAGQTSNIDSEDTTQEDSI